MMKVRRGDGEGGPEKVLHSLLDLAGNDGWNHGLLPIGTSRGRDLIKLFSLCRLRAERT